MNYLDRLAYESDVWLSVASGGPVDETVSLRAARAAQAARAAGRRLAPSCILCAWLSLTVEHDHCARQIAGDTTKPGGAVRAGIQFALALVVIWICARWVL